MQIQGFRRAASMALLALATSSCTTYGFEKQDLGLRHDVKADTVELVVVSRGLYETMGYSAERIAQDAAGARHVILMDFPFEFPLDKMQEDLRTSPDPLATRALAFLQGITVVKAGAWADPGGEPALFQRISIPHAAEGLALLSEWINRLCLEEEFQADMKKDWDARSAELFGAHVRAGKSWAALEEGKLVVRIPMSPEGAARCLEEVLRTDDSVLWFAHALSALSIEDGVATLTFAPDEDGWIRLRPEFPHKDARKPWAPTQGTTLPTAPPSEIASFLAGGNPAPKDGR
jgi:hypothetical protein